MPKPEEEKVITTACTSHCGGKCLLKVHVKAGVITRIETDDGEEPQLRACLRCRAFRQRVYDPNRIMHPMKRTGARGEGKFQRISWDEALDTVVGQMQRVRSTYGPSAMLVLFGGGDTSKLHITDTLKPALNLSGGYTTRWGTHSFEGGLFSAMATYGTLSSLNDHDDLINSRLIIMWGWDPANTVQETNTTWFLLRAREAGAKIVSIDPRCTCSTSMLADRWIPIRPGTDTAMLVAMAHVMIIENLHDQKFLDDYTVGFDRFKDYVLGKEDGIPKTPSWAEKITGVSSNVIAGLAREYATTKPAALVSGVGPGRTAYGEQYHRAAETLTAMTGNIGVHGGWASRGYAPATHFGGFNFQLGKLPESSNPVEANAPLRKDSLLILKGSRTSARIHFSVVADAILKGKAGGYPADLRMLFVMHTNPLNQNANTNKMVQAFNKLEFIVVAEQVMNATARYADILLPVSTYMERNDLSIGGAPNCGYVNKAIEPLGESKSPLEIGCALEKKLGIKGGYSARTEDEWLRTMVKGSLVPDYDTLKKKGVYHARVPEPRVAFEKQVKDLKNNPFSTPSGKIEIYCQRLADMESPGIPPIPKYIETWESRNDPLAARYPLQMITSHFRRRTHTQFENLPWLKELVPQALTMNSKDAGARGIKSGDKVRIFNDRGQVVIPVIVNERIMPGVVDLPEGGWYSPDKRGVDRGGCANVLTLDKPSPAGAAAYNTNLVQVEKAVERESE